MNQILPLNSIITFQGPVSRANDRRRIELNSTFKVLFQGMKDTDFVIEVTLNKEMLLQRMKELIEEKGIMPCLIYFCKK